MLRLRPFKRCDAPLVASWLTDEAMMHRWCANEFTRFPLTAEDLLAYYDARENDPDYFAMTAFTEDGPVGQFILQFRDEAKTDFWLGFVLIDPARRGCGLGRDMMAQAVRFAFEIAGAQKLTLAVFKNNPFAKRCYESVGFRCFPCDLPPLIVMGSVWDADWMELYKGKETL